MSPMTLDSWLRHRLSEARLGALSMAAVSAAGALASGLFTGWILFITLGYISLQLAPGLSLSWAIAASLLAVALLFWANRRTDRAYLETLSLTSGTSRDEIHIVYLPGVGLGTTVNPLAPDSLHSFLKIIVTLLLTAPRLADHARGDLARARQLKTPDLDALGAVLSQLLERDVKVPLAELSALRQHAEPGALFTQLRALRGLVFLAQDPAGLKVGAELRQELMASA